jgi:23S rRNA maturation-related 3'-5' exoribonuclease YhaM
MKLSIDKVQRLGVIEDLPYAKTIKNEELRELVYDAWAMSLSSSSFARINDMPCSPGPGASELKGRGQAAHLNGVARIGVSIAQGLKDEVGQFQVDLDEVIAGGLCHDLGKAWEYDPANLERWSDHRITGPPSLRHPLFGVFVALTAGLPEQIVHIAGTHSAEGENITRSLVGEIIAIADETFWRVLISGRLLEE